MTTLFLNFANPDLADLAGCFQVCTTTRLPVDTFDFQEANFASTFRWSD